MRVNTSMVITTVSKKKIVKIVLSIIILVFSTFYASSPNFRIFLLNTFAATREEIRQKILDGTIDLDEKLEKRAKRLGIDLPKPKKEKTITTYGTKKPGSCFSDYSNTYYDDGDTVLYGGAGDYWKCRNGNFVPCTQTDNCQITDLADVPTYLQDEYDKAKKKLDKSLLDIARGSTSQVSINLVKDSCEKDPRFGAGSQVCSKHIAQYALSALQTSNPNLYNQATQFQNALYEVAIGINNQFSLETTRQKCIAQHGPNSPNCNEDNLNGYALNELENLDPIRYREANRIQEQQIIETQKAIENQRRITEDAKRIENLIKQVLTNPAEMFQNYTFTPEEESAVQRLCISQYGPSTKCDTQNLVQFLIDHPKQLGETQFNQQLAQLKEQRPEVDTSGITFNPSSLSPIGSIDNPYSNILNPEFNQALADYENKSYGKEYAICQNKQSAEERYACNQNTDNLEKALASAPLGVANYVESFKPKNMTYRWEALGYKSYDKCRNSYSSTQTNIGSSLNSMDPYSQEGGSFNTSCGDIIYSKEQITSSIKLGTNLTILAGIPAVSAPAIIAGYGAGGIVGIVGAGIATLGQMGVLSTVYQTSVTANAWIEDPGSFNTWMQTGNMAISWINLGTVDMITKAAGVLNTTQKAINTGVSVANLGLDSYNVTEYCFGDNYDPLNCGMNVAAIAFDVGGGFLDFSQNQLLWGKQANINPPKINVDAPKIDVPDPNGSRYISPSQMDEILKPSDMLFSPRDVPSSVDDMALAMTSVVQSDTVPKIVFDEPALPKIDFTDVLPGINFGKIAVSLPSPPQMLDSIKKWITGPVVKTIRLSTIKNKIISLWNNPQVVDNPATIRATLWNDAKVYIKENGGGITGFFKWITGPTKIEAPGFSTIDNGVNLGRATTPNGVSLAIDNLGKSIAKKITVSLPSSSQILDSLGNTRNAIVDLFDRYVISRLTNTAVDYKISKSSLYVSSDEASSIYKYFSENYYPGNPAFEKYTAGLHVDVFSFEFNGIRYVVKIPSGGMEAVNIYINSTLQGQRTIVRQGLVDDLAPTTFIPDMNGNTVGIQRFVDGPTLYLINTPQAKTAIDLLKSHGLGIIDPKLNIVLTPNGPMIIDQEGIFLIEDALKQIAKYPDIAPYYKLWIDHVPNKPTFLGNVLKNINYKNVGIVTAAGSALVLAIIGGGAVGISLAYYIIVSLLNPINPPAPVPESIINPPVIINEAPAEKPQFTQNENTISFTERVKIYFQNQGSGILATIDNVSNNFQTAVFLTKVYNNFNTLSNQQIADIINQAEGTNLTANDIDKNNPFIFTKYINSEIANNPQYFTNLNSRGKNSLSKYITNEVGGWYNDFGQMTQCVVWTVTIKNSGVNITPIQSLDIDNAVDIYKLAEKNSSFNYTANHFSMSELLHNPSIVEENKNQDVSFYLDSRGDNIFVFAHKFASINSVKEGDVFEYDNQENNSKDTGHMGAILDIKYDSNGKPIEWLISEANSPKGSLDGTPQTYWVDEQNFYLLVGNMQEVVFIREENFNFLSGWLNN